MRAPSLSLCLLALLAAPLLAACDGGDDGDDDDQDPEPGDGKVHPPPNGVHTTESDACAALLAGHGARHQALGCAVSTTRTCPNLIRAQVGGVACMEFDEGSVQGCVAHFNEQTTCDALGQALDRCVITSYPGTEPNGCRTP